MIRAAFFVALLAMFAPASALATALDALPQSSGVNATDTLPVCQFPTGCGPSNLLTQMPVASILGIVGPAITSATTLGNNYNNIVTPVSGTGYTITLPQSTPGVLPTGSKIYLVAAPGSAIDVCVASGSGFDANSSAPLAAKLCSGSTSGVALAGGMALSVTSESGGNYFASLAVAGVAIETAKTGNYTVSYAADAGRIIPIDCTSGCTLTMPVASSFPAGQWVEIDAENGSANITIATTSPATIYGVPNNLSDPGTINEVPGVGARLVSDGTNWFATQWGIIPGDDSWSGTSFTADVWDCYQPRHFTSSTAVTVTIPAGLPAGCVLNMVQDGTGQVGVIGGSGMTLHAVNGDAHSAAQYAIFFVEIESGGSVGILGGNIVP